MNPLIGRTCTLNERTGVWIICAVELIDQVTNAQQWQFNEQGQASGFVERARCPTWHFLLLGAETGEVISVPFYGSGGIKVG